MALALAAYLAALGVTPAGQGWRLAGHLATSHGEAPIAAPSLRAERPADGLTVLPTLRADAAPEAPHHHAHGPAHEYGHGHTAKPGPATAHVHPAAHVHTAAPDAAPDAPHHHGGVAHRHDEAPAHDAPAALRVSVDVHAVPAGVRLPAAPPPGAPVAARTAAPGSAAGSVETPPPLAVG